MGATWRLGVTLAGAAALVMIAVGVTYLAVDAGSLPAAMGKIAGSSDHRTVRGYFAVMVGGLLLLVAIVLNQFQPGGSWTVAGDAVEAPPSPADEVLGQPAATEPGQESAGTGPADGAPAGPDAGGRQAGRSTLTAWTTRPTPTRSSICRGAGARSDGRSRRPAEASRRASSWPSGS